MKIIIIDDDKLVCSSLKTILSSKGIHVCATGNNGAEAIKLYEQHRPDILLMDIRMETINGVDASKQILSSFPQARILFLTKAFLKVAPASAIATSCGPTPFGGLPLR